MYVTVNLFYDRVSTCSVLSYKEDRSLKSTLLTPGLSRSCQDRVSSTGCSTSEGGKDEREGGEDEREGGED